jgi:hypothetical protein
VIDYKPDRGQSADPPVNDRWSVFKSSSWGFNVSLLLSLIGGVGLLLLAQIAEAAPVEYRYSGTVIDYGYVNQRSIDGFMRELPLPGQQATMSMIWDPTALTYCREPGAPSTAIFWSSCPAMATFTVSWAGGTLDYIDNTVETEYRYSVNQNLQAFDAIAGIVFSSGYRLYFQSAYFPDGPPACQVGWGPGAVPSPALPAPGSTFLCPDVDWTHHYFQYQVSNNGYLSRFYVNITEGGAVVPIPSAASLFSIALAGLAWVRRR